MNLISELKASALRHSLSNTSTEEEKLRTSLHYYPGIERHHRTSQLLNTSTSLHHLLSSGTASLSNLNLLIKSQSLQGNMRGALKTFEEMESLGYTADEETFVSLLQGTVVSKDAPLSRALFLKSRVRLLHPTLRIYTTLIKAHVSSHELKNAFALLRKMEDEGMEGNVVVYTTLIDGLIRDNQIERAFKLFWSCRTWKGMQPDEVLFTVMMKGCAKRRECEKAINLLDDMKLCGLHPTDVTYTEMIHSCCRRRDFVDKCFEFYQQMVVEDMPVSQRCYTYLLQACSTSGNIKRAKEILKAINADNIPLSVEMYTKCILLFAAAMRLPKLSTHERSGNLRNAWQVVHEMRRRGLPMNTKLLNAITKVYINGGYTNYAVDMLPQYAAFKCKPDVYTYRSLLQMFYYGLKDYTRFFDLWRYMRQSTKIRPTSMCQMVLSASLDSRSLPETLNILKEMYASKVFPSPSLTDKLSKVGQRVTEIHVFVNMFVELQKNETQNKTQRRQQWIQTNIDEYELEVFKGGKTLKTVVTPEQEVRSNFFRKKNKIKRGKFPSFDEYKKSKQKGGDAYAERNDKIKSNLLFS